jgi:putative SOS response-associated peptidase YedK
MGTDGWYQLETHTWITNLGYEYENHIFDRMPAFYENGVVEVWLVNPSNGIEIYLGYVQETVWQMVRTISD